MASSISSPASVFPVPNALESNQVSTGSGITKTNANKKKQLQRRRREKERKQELATEAKRGAVVGDAVAVVRDAERGSMSVVDALRRQPTLSEIMASPELKAAVLKQADSEVSSTLGSMSTRDGDGKDGQEKQGKEKQGKEKQGKEKQGKEKMDALRQRMRARRTPGGSQHISTRKSANHEQKLEMYKETLKVQTAAMSEKDFTELIASVQQRMGDSAANVVREIRDAKFNGGNPM